MAQSRMAGVLAAFSLAGAASAGVTDINITGAFANSNWNLSSGWDEGQEWGWNLSPNLNDASAWSNEVWAAGGPASLNIQVVTDGIDPDVTITKNLVNTTGFAWTSFQIDLFQIGGFGPVSVYPASVASSRFGSTSTLNSAGNAFMTFGLLGPQTPVLPGENVSFFFTFNIPGDVVIKMTQTPIPAPGTASGLALVALIGLRRRR